MAQVINWQQEVVSEISLAPEIFYANEAGRKDIIHSVINWQLAKRRAGTHKTKTRGEVSGSTRKIKRQKGGGARHGSIRANIFRKGGVVFGPLVRSHEFKLNKKVRLLGLKHALSIKAKENKIIILQDLSLSSSKTRELKEKLGKLVNIPKKSVLIIGESANTNLLMASSNLHYVDVLPVMGLNVYDLIQQDYIFITPETLAEITDRLNR